MIRFIRTVDFADIPRHSRSFLAAFSCSFRGKLTCERRRNVDYSPDAATTPKFARRDVAFLWRHREESRRLVAHRSSQSRCSRFLLPLNPSGMKRTPVISASMSPRGKLMVRAQSRSAAVFAPTKQADPSMFAGADEHARDHADQMSPR